MTTPIKNRSRTMSNAKVPRKLLELRQKGRLKTTVKKVQMPKSSNSVDTCRPLGKLGRVLVLILVISRNYFSISVFQGRHSTPALGPSRARGYSRQINHTLGS